ncbi:MAG: DUF4367 domain-containing protein [Ruminococcus sp.]|nr:DUF4367 domain-containing protein [Ruminococcus sp.]
MNKDELRIQMTDLNVEILSDLKKELADEKGKPADERDNSFISELEEMIAQTEEEILSESQVRSLDKSLKMLDEYKHPKKKNLVRIVSVAAAALMVVLGLNTASMKVFGQNMFSAAYKLNKGSITITTDDSSKSSELAVSPSDPYGMKAKCAEYGFFPDTPSYIPEGFDLEHISEDSDDYSDIVLFFYKKGNAKLNIQFNNYKTQDDIPAISIPTDTYNISEKEINGNTVHIVEEDKQFTATYTKDMIRYVIFAENLDYEECDKVLLSLS